GVELTPAGRDLLEYARRTLALVARAGGRIRGLETEEIGSFAVGCHVSLGSYFLPSFLKSFLSRAPGIALSLWERNSAALHPAVPDRVVDFGIVVEAMPHPDLVIIELFHDRFELCAVPAPGDGGLAAARERLRREPLIYAGRVTQSRTLVDRLGAEA